MLINLLSELRELYKQGGILNINYKQLIINNLYNDVITCLELENINYDIIEYCCMLIDKHYEFIKINSI